MWLGYVFRFDNLAFESATVMYNVVFWSKEIHHLLCKHLKLIVGEIGPVEVELIVSTIVFLGGYLGTDGLQSTIESTIGVCPVSFIAEI